MFSGPLGAVGLSAIIIVVGILVMILGALGIIGGFMQHKVPLGIVSHPTLTHTHTFNPPPTHTHTQYIVALALVIIAELALAIVAIVKKDDLVSCCVCGCMYCIISYVPLQNAAIDVNIDKIFDNYAEDNKTDITTINFVQKLVSVAYRLCVPTTILL